LQVGAASAAKGEKKGVRTLGEVHIAFASQKWSSYRLQDAETR
jgi:hypothetical protein